MIKFRYLPHTADIEFIAYGRTVKELLNNSLLALFTAMSEVKRVERADEKPGFFAISEKAASREEIIWYMLQDALSKIDALGVTAFDAKVVAMKETKDGIYSKCTIAYKRTKDYPKFDVKAVTPHDLKVKVKDGVLYVRITLDV